MKKLSLVFTRSKELGPWGTLKNGYSRTVKRIDLWRQSVWWGWLARQAMSDTQLLAHTTGAWPTIETFLEHLAQRPAASFLLPHESPQTTLAFLNQSFPEYLSAVITAAEAACQNELTLLGQTFHFPNGIDWQTDPVTNWAWPHVHRSQIGAYLASLPQPIDLIFFWELNRQQHFITLGIAYWLTGEEKYQEAFSAQIENWIETNPLQHGLNWYFPLEVSIRLLSWTVAFQFFRNSPKFQAKTAKVVLKSLWQQADFISQHLQTTRTDTPNNHLLAELTGLILLGTTFPEFRASAAWQATGLELLNQQATAQTHADGVNKEQASGYQRFVAELLLLVVARSRQGQLPPQPALEQTLKNMLNYLLFSQTPAGTVPHWGDTDYGRALGLGQNKDFWDFRPLLAAGAILFGRSDWKFAAGRLDEEAFWLLGSHSWELWQKIDAAPPDRTSQAFPQAGLYSLRETWTAETDVAFFRCGPFGLGGPGNCAHAHADLLSLTLWVNGRPLLVDSGTYTYRGPWRDAFRLTAAHNTVLIDQRDQAVPLPNFNWQEIPTARCLDWSEKSVTGVMTCPGAVNFVRQITHPSPELWELVDQFTGPVKTHEVTWYFHLATDLTMRWAADAKSLLVETQGRPYVQIFPPQNVLVERQSGWFSASYGKKEPNPMLSGHWAGELSNKQVNFCWKFVHLPNNQ